MVSAPALRSESAWALLASFSHSLGKIREQDREPQPQRDLQIKTESSLMPEPVPSQQNGSRNTANFNHKHHGILHHVPRIQLNQ